MITKNDNYHQPIDQQNPLTHQQVFEILNGAHVNDYNRFEIFLHYSKRLQGKDYWQSLSFAYCNSDDLYGHKRDIREAFTSNEPDQHYLMDDREQQFLGGLPEKITIYRGMTTTELDSGNYGISWTLDKNIAEFYADQYWRNFNDGDEKIVISRTINKNNAIAYLNDRNEHEIIYILDRHIQ